MSDNLNVAKEILYRENLTCVAVKGNEVYKSNKRGVLPLVEWFDQGINLKGFSVADKVVGKAAAFVYILLGVGELYAGVISESALKLLKQNNVSVSFDSIVDFIKNRTNTGFCPMEQATLSIVSPEDAIVAIKNKIAELNSK